MEKSAVYFFAEQPHEWVMWAGLADILREIRADLPLVFIYVDDPRWREYQRDLVLDRFDQIHKVSLVSWSHWNKRVTLGNIYAALRKSFPAARRVASELRDIKLQPNSVAFVYSGASANQALFLRRIRSEETVDSVVLLPFEQTSDSSPSDFTVEYSQSAYLNFYFHYFGTAYIDYYWLRPPTGKTSEREFRYRNKPADFVFYGVHPFRRRTPKIGEAYYPFYLKETSRAASRDSVVLLGDNYKGHKLRQMGPFYDRFNELVDLIRKKHNGARLIYKPHPGESSRQTAPLDLSGFETVSSVGSEYLAMKDPSISTAYSFASNSGMTMAYFGVRTHSLYHLFDDDIVPKWLKKRLDDRLGSSLHPEMCIQSVEGWLSGNNNYKLTDVSEWVRTSTIKMLQAVGVVDPAEGLALDGCIVISPEDRWVRRPDLSPSALLRSVARRPKRKLVHLLRKVSGKL